MDGQNTKEMKLIKTGMITQKITVESIISNLPKRKLLVHMGSLGILPNTQRRSNAPLYKFFSKREMKPSPAQFSEASLAMIQNLLRTL